MRDVLLHAKCHLDGCFMSPLCSEKPIILTFCIGAI